MNTLNERYSAEDVLQHVDDPSSFIEAFKIALVRREEAKQAFINRLTPEVKAEWIGGEPVFHSPARHAHNAARNAIETLFTTRWAGSDLDTVSSEKAMMQVGEDLYEPDVAIWINLSEPFDNEMIIYPPCNLVVEVLSKKTKEKDRGIKFINYAKAGVDEYWIVDAEKETVERYLNEDSAYAIESIYGLGDIISSEALGGAELPVGAFFSQSSFAEALVGMLTLLKDRLSN